MGTGKKTMEYESDGDTNCIQDTRYSHPRIGTGTGGLGNKMTSGDHQNCSIIKVGQNTEKSPWDMKEIVVTETLANTCVKTLKGV